MQELVPNAAGENTSRFRHIRELDGVRGIAALMVFFHHAFYADLDLSAWHGSVPWFMQLASFGESGVDLFFVLSGFLITSLLIQDRKSPRYYQDFYWKRALRILPLYFVCLAFMAILHRSLGTFLLGAVFLANVTNLFHVAPVGAFWSLAIEEQFYLLWPTLIRKGKLENLVRWALLLAVVPILLRIGGALVDHHNYRLTFLRCDGLALGALLAYRHRTLPESDKSRQREVWVSGLLVFCGAGLLSASSFVLGHLHRHADAWADAAWQTAVTFIAAAVVTMVVNYAGAPVLAFLRSRVLVFFGLISYAFYLLHGGPLTLFDRHFGPPAPGRMGALFGRALFALALSIVLSLISRYALELPALSLRKYVLSKPNPHANAEDPPLPLARM